MLKTIYAGASAAGAASAGAASAGATSAGAASAAGLKFKGYGEVINPLFLLLLLKLRGLKLYFLMKPMGDDDHPIGTITCYS